MKSLPLSKIALFHRCWSLVAIALSLWSSSALATTVKMETTSGSIEIELNDAEAPATVANFLAYVRSGAYNGTFIHRSVPGFIIQGGGFQFVTGGSVNSVVTAAPVINEFSAMRSNVRGTIAMAKLGSDPNSATSQWFFNLANNAANLDNQNGGFTVFGQVVGDGMRVVDAIAALPIANLGGAFAAIPLVSPSAGTPIVSTNLVELLSVSIVQPATSYALSAGWNLIGNSTNATWDVAALLGNNGAITTVWTWLPSNSQWAFYSPALTGQALTDYSVSKGYAVLSTIKGGEGLWVNAKQSTTVSLPIGTAVTAAQLGPTLGNGWTLAAVGEALTAAAFCQTVAVGQVTTLWAWSGADWFFYAPSLDSAGTLLSYVNGKGYRDFTESNKMLGSGVGFWVNRQ